MLTQPAARNAHQNAELPIDFLVRSTRKGESERESYSAIAFCDVAVIPEYAHAVRIGHVSQSGHRPRMQQPHTIGIHRPPDIPPPAESLLDRSRKVSNRKRCFIAHTRLFRR